MNFIPVLAPEVLLVVLGLGLLLWEAFGQPTPKAIGRAALLGVAAVGLSAWAFFPFHEGYYWGGLYTWDRFGLLFKEFFLVATMLTTVISLHYEERLPVARAEFYILPLFTAAGMLLLASVHDFILLFVALELITVSFYVLVAFQRNNPAALEAGVKYLIIGALASAFLVMGIAYVFGFTGSTQFDVVAGAIETGNAPAGLLFGILLVLVGIGFKIAAVPFHIWAPDVYQGAPTPITAFLAVASKAAGFVVLLRVLDQPFAAVIVESRWVQTLSALAVLSLLLGNLAALPQRNVKRLMAYSGIGHAGFLLVALAANSIAGHQAVVVYLVAYLVASYAIFLVLAIVSRESGRETLQDFVGLSRRSPLLAWTIALALLSLAGIPPLLGFFAKFLVFLAAWQSQQYGLVAAGVVAATAGLYYYLAIVRSMFWADPVETAPIRVGFGTQALCWGFIAATLGLGLWVKPLLAVVRWAL